MPNETAKDGERALAEEIAREQGVTLPPRPTREGRKGESNPISVPNEFTPVHGLVAHEFQRLMRARQQIGTERYGVPLQPFNTRDAGMDAFEEFGDLGAYLQQLRFEHAYMINLIKTMYYYFERDFAKLRCRSYDGIYDGQGPCWTCQGHEEQCELGQIREDVKPVLAIQLKEAPSATDL